MQFEYRGAGREKVDLFVDGKPAGKGYCLVSSCHFDLDMPDLRRGRNRISATFSWFKDQLIVNGQSFGEGFVYEDILTLAK